MRNSIDAEVPPCVGAQRKKGFASRFSLRRLIYASPILGQRRQLRSSSGSSRPSTKSQNGNDGKPGGSSSKDNSNLGTKQFRVEIHQAQSRSSVNGSHAESISGCVECPLCLVVLPSSEFFEISQCGHRACMSCLQQYLRVQITESRVCISCPECSESMHPNEIRTIVNDEPLFAKYEDFMVRRVLAADADARWCPAPDCSFAVVASGCASCPKIRCERPGCDSFFCYHCKAEWHPNQTCDAARARRSPNGRSGSATFSQDSRFRDTQDIKPCPRCQVLIVKMDDGSCNHMMCAVCGAEFCWLCMKEISDLHYLSPSGCTFWGKKPWSRKKKILWQLGTLVGAPVGIALVAGITVPAMIIGIPVWVGRKLYGRYKNDNKHKRNAAIVGGVMASVLISPILAGLAVGIGVPILLFYVYGVVPVSLCRSGGCGGAAGVLDDADLALPEPDAGSEAAAAAAVADLHAQQQQQPPHPGHRHQRHQHHLEEHHLEEQRVANPSIDADRDSASTVALAGSVGGGGGPGGGGGAWTAAKVLYAQRLSIGSLSDKSVNASLPDDGGASTRALAGSMLNYKAAASDTCSSCAAHSEDCASEDRVRLEDLGAALSAEGGGGAAGGVSSSSSSSVCVEIGCEEHHQHQLQQQRPAKRSTSATLRSQFFLSSADDAAKGNEAGGDSVVVEMALRRTDTSEL